MYRKMLGVFTAVAAALLLVGVAWAFGGDAAGNLSGSASLAQGSVATDVTTSGSVATDVTTSGSVATDVTTSGSDDDSSTGISLVDNSSTSTSVNGSSSTSTTIDDEDEDEDELLDVITGNPKTYEIGSAATVTVQVAAGQLVLLDLSVNSGWSFEIDKADGREIKIELESGSSAEAEFEAKLDDGRFEVVIEQD